jgi:hypothetical protein
MLGMEKTSVPSCVHRKLSQDEILRILDRVREQWMRPPVESMAVAFARAIEQAHGIK